MTNSILDRSKRILDVEGFLKLKRHSPDKIRKVTIERVKLGEQSIETPLSSKYIVETF